MARPSGEKTRCSGMWTEAKFRSFIKSSLRSTTMKWAPIQQCKRNARVGRGLYLCSCCKKTVTDTILVDRKRVKNTFVDHIAPVIDPTVGWVSWDNTIDGLFAELDNLQLLCKECHDVKSKEERQIATERRKKEKLQQF